MFTVELSTRQLEILRLVTLHEPIVGEQIAELLGVSRPTIRPDLSLLVALGQLNAKPKVGYFIAKSSPGTHDDVHPLLAMTVRQVQSMPIVVRDTTPLYDAVVTLFLEDIGSLIILDKDDYLCGIASRKDLLQAVMGHTQTATVPISMIMTRYPNVVTIGPEDSIIEAARRMIHNRVDSLPVVEVAIDHTDNPKLVVIGRITKTTMTKVLVGIATFGET